STTSRTVRIPHQEREVVGYDDFTRDEVVSQLSSRFFLPKFHYVALFPDGRYWKSKVPKMRRYLPDSPEALQFIANLPQSISFDEANRLANTERSSHATTPSPAKKRRQIKLYGER